MAGSTTPKRVQTLPPETAHRRCLVTLPRTGSAPPETTGYQSIRALPFVPVVSHLHFAVIIVVAGASTDVIIEVDEQPPKALHLQPPHVVLEGKY